MPVVRVIIPTALRQYAANHDAVEVEAASVEQALGDLVSQFDQLRRHLYADDGRLRNFVNVYVNEEDIRYLEKAATPLKEGDTISIVPSIAGGSFSLMDRLGAKRQDVLMPAEIKRYSPHLILPEAGMAGPFKTQHSLPPNHHPGARRPARPPYTPAPPRPPPCHTAPCPTPARAH